jgi:mannitol/fructose-specific phosphotransferase system IIA component (Ntr-type)
MRITNNTVDGILRAVVETKAGLVICPFENYAQPLLDNCLPSIIFAKIVKNISSAKRVRAIFAPTSEDNSDVGAFVAELKHFSQQINAEIVFYLSQSQKEKIMEKINKFLKNTVKYRIVTENNWSALKHDLPNDINEDDAIVVFMDARQKLFHSPSVDKYPFHLAEQFKRNNIFAVYSPLSLVGLENEENLFEENVEQAISEHPKLEVIKTQNSDFESIINSITQKNGVPASEIYDILLTSLESYPVELVPGAILIHAHIETIENPQTFIWFQNNEQEISPLKVSPKTLIIVLNPLNGDPQIHLKTLSRIAGLFMNSRCKEIIRNCRTAEELVRELQNF